MAVPDPPANLKPRLITWPQDQPMYRVYSTRYSPSSFNDRIPNHGVEGRFHFFAFNGVQVSVMYAAESTEAAVFETIFHDLPHARPTTFLRAPAINERAVAMLLPRRDLVLVELMGAGLQRLGLRPDELTSTPPSDYPQTVKWAAALFAHPSMADGMVWMSRQYNTARSLVLWGPRVGSQAPQPQDVPIPLSYGKGLELVNAAAEAADVTLL